METIVILVSAAFYTVGTIHYVMAIQANRRKS